MSSTLRIHQPLVDSDTCPTAPAWRSGSRPLLWRSRRGFVIESQRLGAGKFGTDRRAHPQRKSAISVNATEITTRLVKAVAEELSTNGQVLSDPGRTELETFFHPCAEKLAAISVDEQYRRVLDAEYKGQHLHREARQSPFNAYGERTATWENPGITFVLCTHSADSPIGPTALGAMRKNAVGC